MNLLIDVVLTICVGVILAFCILETFQAASNTKPIKRELNNTIVIDGCQYLTYSTYQNFMGITHKGNCTNSIHIYAKTN